MALFRILPGELMRLLQQLSPIFRGPWNGARSRFGGYLPSGMALVGLCAVALAWTNVLVHLSEEKAQAEQAALQNAANLTRALEEHLGRAVKAVDLTLLGLRATYEKDPKHFNIMRWRQRNSLLVDLLSQISIVDRNGNRLLTSIDDGAPPADLRDSDYFRFHLHSGRDELFIGAPATEPASGRVVIPVARRLSSPDGSFAGVIVAALDPAYLSRLYDSVDVGTQGAIVLVGTDGIIRARGVTSDDRSSIGHSLAASPVMRRFAREPVGSFRSPGLIDGTVRLFAYRTVKDFPLIIEVGFAEDEVLASYRRDRASNLVTVTLLSALLLLATALVMRRQLHMQRIAAALSDSERKYRSAVDGLNEVILQTDADGRLTFLNPAWTTLTGFSVAESLGRPLSKYVAPDDRPLYAWHVEPIIEGRAEGSSQDMRFLSKDGALRWFEVHVGAEREEKGAIVGLSGTLNDITQRKVMELELHRSRDMLDRAQHIAQTGSFDHDIVTGKGEWSDELYRIYGYDPGQGGGSLQMSLSRVVADDRGKFLSFGQHMTGSVPSSSVDFRITRLDGAERILHRECDVVIDDTGKPVRIFGTVQDITERKQVEEALRDARDVADRSARAKSEFLAMMSHEIRSPMNGVVGLLDLLRQTRLESEQKQMIAMAHDSAISLLDVLNDILDFSKIEAGRIAIAPEPIELSRFAQSVCEPLAHAASQKGLTFECRIEPGVPDVIKCDPVRLRQIIVNLLGNAIKFTPRGWVRLDISPLAATDRGPMLTFTVTDTGIGMTAEVISRLFQPFSQADASTTRNFGGTGLGLSISQRLAGLLGGTLEVTSDPGVGSAFALAVPLVVADRSTLAPSTADGGNDLAVLRGRCALVAEDLPTNRWLIVRQLQNLGLSADAVDNGQAAIAALASRNYDLLITDFHMPKMDGTELTARIRAAEKRDGTARLPIIGLTADATSDSRDRCLAAGMDGIVAKPTDMQSLGEALRRLLLPQTDAPSVPGAAASRGAIFDDRPFRELFQRGDPEGTEWLAALLDSAQDLFIELRNHVAAGDRAALAACAHRLAGVALSGGAMLLGETCRTIEARAKSGETSKFGELVATAEAALNGARKEIAYYMSSRKEVVP